MARIVLTLEDGVEIVTELDSDVITVGRHPESIVVLPSASVSSHHATIKRRAGDFFVQDLGTTNGTKVNGVDVEESKLEDGDKITFGDIQGYVHLTDAPARRDYPEPPPRAPDIIAPSAPPIPSMTRRRSSSGPKRSARVNQYQESTGCASFLIFLVLMVIAFIVGLHLRHYVITEQFLFNDLLKKMSDRAAEHLEEPAPPEGETKSGGATPAAPAPAPNAPANPAMN
jgi:hypothetical protein